MSPSPYNIPRPINRMPPHEVSNSCSRKKKQKKGQTLHNLNLVFTPGLFTLFIHRMVKNENQSEFQNMNIK